MTRVAAWALAAALAGGAAALPAQEAVEPSAGTREMAALLAERAAAVQPGNLWFNVNGQRADTLAAALAGRLPSAEPRRRRGTTLAKELLFAGRYAESVALVDELLKDVASIDDDQLTSLFAEVDLLMLKATTLMRWGEEQNCVLRQQPRFVPAADQGRGRAHAPRGSTQRRSTCSSGSSSTIPTTSRARWLLNIAHMTLGEYPDGVPAQWLIPPAAFASEYPLPPLRRRRRPVGLDIYGLAGGAIIDDFDNDGHLDLDGLAPSGFDRPAALLPQQRRRHASPTHRAGGLTGLIGGLNIVQADYDNDGFIDVLVLRGAWLGAAGRFPMSLLRNNGDGTFTDVTEGSRAAPLPPDADRDLGRLRRRRLARSLRRQRVDPDRRVQPLRAVPQQRRRHLHRRAREASASTVVAFVKGVVSGDYDNDGRPDLYLSVAAGRRTSSSATTARRAGRRRPAGTSPTSPRQAGVTEPDEQLPTWFFDYDNDGWLDLFVTGYSGQRRGRRRRRLPRPADTPAERAAALPQQPRRHVRRRHARGGPLHGHPGDGR